ncbi:hypothetical protein [Alteromonas sp. ASW11-130]|uniref:hypothetical protein n=1 Tax=Alteromonas sp. ASW11-130 TaxID=3015775 RepID=UPI002241C37B|nr:hypothetical protein [Alteromonas sp. ASW11-130]MCW8093141.1 hypothetical protein [Alteromonas sp. ASW11-130]
MPEKQIKPDKITKPIQLLAAWLVGLLSLSSCFLVAATSFDETSWQSGTLVIAAILNVPIFLGAVFLLQTRFRPELQEDSYYSSYLNRKTNEEIKVPKSESHFNEISIALGRLEERFKSQTSSENPRPPEKSLLIGLNKHLEDRKEIMDTLGAHGIQKITSFGPKEPPENRVMSISSHLDESEVEFAINIARKIGMEGYNFFNNWEEETEEVILIGSYGEAEFFLLPKNA